MTAQDRVRLGIFYLEFQFGVNTCVHTVDIIGGLVYIRHVRAERQSRSRANTMYDGRVEWSRTAQTVNLKEIAARLVVRIGMVVLQIPVAVIFHRIPPSCRIRVVITGFDKPEQTRLTGHMIRIQTLGVTRIIHSRYAICAYYRIARVITAEIFAEQQNTVHAQFRFRRYTFLDPQPERRTLRTAVDACDIAGTRNSYLVPTGIRVPHFGNG